MHERGVVNLNLEARIQPGATTREGFNISGRVLVANDQRGLMYGLLQAAEDIRRDGKLSDAKQSPQVGMRGIRYFLHNADLERDWYYSRVY